MTQIDDCKNQPALTEAYVEHQLRRRTNLPYAMVKQLVGHVARGEPFGKPAPAVPAPSGDVATPEDKPASDDDPESERPILRGSSAYRRVTREGPAPTIVPAAKDPGR